MSELIVASLAGLIAFMIARKSSQKIKHKHVGGDLSGVDIEKILYKHIGGIPIIMSNKTILDNPEQLFIESVVDLPKLLFGAIEVLEKYLPNDNTDYDDRTKWFGRNDETLRRIFSHNYEKKLVDANPEKYSQIKFPERVLVIKKDGIKLKRQDTLDFIKKNLKFNKNINVSSTLPSLDLTLNNEEGKYTFLNYTTFIPEQDNTGKLLKQSGTDNHIAWNQIVDLCKELGTVDYTNDNVHYINGIVWIKDLKNKGQNRCPTEKVIKKSPAELETENARDFELFLKKLNDEAELEKLEKLNKK